MNVQFLLKGNKTYQWHYLEDVFFIGYFYADRRFYRNSEALQYIFKNFDSAHPETFSQQIYGCFCIIIQDKETVTIISDTVNFFPIFYTVQEGALVISDFFDDIINYIQDLRLNHDAFAEFRCAGFVLQNETLAQGILKTNNNQILKITKFGTTTTSYFDFLPKTFFTETNEEISLKLKSILEDVSTRLIAFLDNRTAIVPLSGGYDSRLIVSLLKNAGCQKVIAITYGKPNPEVAISQSVAEKLGYKWFFIDYAKIDIEKYRQDPQFANYLDYAANGFSMPYLMEYFALAELLEKKLIPEDAVFLPGHSGDFLGGSYVMKTVKNTQEKDSLAQYIARKYFLFIQKNGKINRQLEKRIRKSLKDIPFHREKEYFSTIEEWDYREKLSKFIFHSSSVFPFWGFEVYFPLWDKALITFFRKLPYEKRVHKNLYDMVLQKFYFTPNQINFDKKELKVSPFDVRFQNVKDQVRYYFPWKMVLKKTDASDWPNYKTLTEKMKTFVEAKQQQEFKNYKNYNAVICAWYLEYLREKSEKISSQ